MSKSRVPGRICARSGHPSILIWAHNPPFWTDCWRSSQPGSLQDRKSTRLNSSHGYISYAVFCLKKKNQVGDEARTGGHHLAALAHYPGHRPTSFPARRRLMPPPSPSPSKAQSQVAIMIDIPVYTPSATDIRTRNTGSDKKISVNTNTSWTPQPPAEPDRSPTTVPMPAAMTTMPRTMDNVYFFFLNNRPTTELPTFSLPDPLRI